MKIKDIKLKGPSEKVKKFVKNFINEHDKGLKAIKALKEIKSMLLPNMRMTKEFETEKDRNLHLDRLNRILKKIYEVEDEN